MSKLIMYKSLTFVVFLLFPLPIFAAESVSAGLFKYHLNFANEGSPESIYVIAGMYERGRGVKQDFKMAIKWYRLAVEKGNTRASKDIDKVLNKISLLKNKEIKNREIKNKENESKENENQENKNKKNENENLESNNLVSKLLENETLETESLANNRLENKTQIKEQPKHNPRFKQSEQTDTMPAVNVKLEAENTLNEENNNVIRPLSITHPVAKNPDQPAPLTGPQIANQDVQKNLDLQFNHQKLRKLLTETEEAKQQSELVRARYERLQREKASLILQMTLERELAKKQMIEIQEIKRQLKIDEKNTRNN